MLFLLTTPFVDSVLRIVVGFACLAMFDRFWPAAGWSLIPYLLVVLFLVRLVPAVLRRVLPVPAEIDLKWARQRQLAKRYDSYQWRKLFWIGVGFAIYLGFSSKFPAGRVSITAFCVFSGLLGLARWRTLSTKVNSPEPAVKQASVSA